MQVNLNWARLVAEGRAKAVGVQWSREEERALREFGIPADYVRSGILTLEDYEKTKLKDETEGKPMEREDLEVLKKEAKELGLEFDWTAVTKEVLIDEIRKKEEKKVAGKSGWKQIMGMSMDELKEELRTRGGEVPESPKRSELLSLISKVY